jgi:hypothetical protein
MEFPCGRQLILGVVIVAVLSGSHPAAAQLRVQETPALNGLGMLFFQDIEVRLDGGRGNTSGTLLTNDDPQQVTRSQWYWGIFVDKPVVAHFLEMGYDCELWTRDWLPRNTWYRDLFFEPIRLVAYYREGDFRVSGKSRDSEFYIGGRYSLDLGRIARHIPIFQK